MRVLHIMPTLEPAYGGPVQALLGLATAQARAGLCVRVLSPFRSDAGFGNADWLRDEGVSVDLIGPTIGPLAWHPQLASRLASAVAHTDIVHIHAVWEQVQHVAARLARRTRKPYIVRPCGMLTTWALHRQSLHKWLKKRVYISLRLRKTLNRAAAIHYTTELEREWTTPLGIRARAIVEPSGFDISEFEHLPERGGFRSKLRIGERPLVVFLGRIFPGKGLEILVPAFAQMPRDDVTLAIVGPDTDGYQSYVESLIENHGLRDRVFFPGMLRGSEKIEALVDADLFCLPSDHENFGLAVIEALAASTPVVVSDQVGVHHQITEGGVGSAVSREPSTLGSELSAWLGDPERLHDAARRARPFVQERFTWERIARRWTEHYRALIRCAAGERQL